MNFQQIQGQLERLYKNNRLKRPISPNCFQKSKYQRTCEANLAGENSSFIFTICVKSVPLYHFKLAYAVPRMAVKEFFETISTNREIGRFNHESHF